MSRHSFTANVLNWRVCVLCGLLRLNNPLSDWAARKGCGFAEDPGWAVAKATLPVQHREAK